MDGKRFTQILHVKSNSEKNPFHCPVCENSLRENLKVKALTKKRNHVIAKCGKWFTQALHANTNTGNSPFHCQMCENILRDNLDIKTHRRETI